MKSKNKNNEFNVVLIFLDGVGIGKNDANVNPFFKANLPALKSLCGGKLPYTPFKSYSVDNVDVISVNATLGLPGLPQSGTGQTAIFTGVNGAKKFGRHFGPHPPSILRQIIAERNIFVQLKSIGRSSVFANAFPKKFLDYSSNSASRLTVTTLSHKLSKIPLLTADELKNNKAISADLIRSQWAELGHPEIKPIKPKEAGIHLASISENYDFTLFEYWLTDHAGHSQKMSFAIEALERFDEFLSGYLSLFDPTKNLLIILSDHGNIEDLSTKSHTRNRVPCIIAGNQRHKISKRIKTLTHVTPAIVRLFNNL